MCLPQTECPDFALKWQAPPSLQVAEQGGIVNCRGMGEAVQDPWRGRVRFGGRVADKLFFRNLPKRICAIQGRGVVSPQHRPHTLGFDTHINDVERREFFYHSRAQARDGV